MRAAKLRALAPIDSAKRAKIAGPVVEQARQKADAAWAAANKKLSPVVVQLQESAMDLLRRMIAVS